MSDNDRECTEIITVTPPISTFNEKSEFFSINLDSKKKTSPLLGVNRRRRRRCQSCGSREDLSGVPSTKYSSWPKRRFSISVMSGLWDWWRRVRESSPAKEENSNLEDGGEDLEDEDGEESETDDLSVNTIYAEVKDLSRKSSSSEGDYTEVKEIAVSPREMNESDVQETKDEMNIENAEEEEEEWSEDEEWEKMFNPAKVPTVTLSLDLRAQRGTMRPMEACVRPVYVDPAELHSVTANLAPVYSTVIKNRQEQGMVIQETTSGDIPISSKLPSAHSKLENEREESGLVVQEITPEAHRVSPKLVNKKRDSCFDASQTPLVRSKGSTPSLILSSVDSTVTKDNGLNSGIVVLETPSLSPEPFSAESTVIKNRSSCLIIGETASIRSTNGTIPDGSITPVSDTSDDPSPPVRTASLQLSFLPPPTPPTPDWDDAISLRSNPQTPWRMGRVKRLRKWLGAGEGGSSRAAAIPNRLSKMISQDYLCHQGQSGFEDLRRYIKQGGDFCKELTAILQERAEAEAGYGKTLGKLSAKLLKATKEGSGTVNSAWHRIAAEMEAQADVHRNFATSLSEEVVKPLKQLVDSQHRIRKSVETAVDKSGKNLAEWRAAESKAKKNSFTCARENEKLRDSLGGEQRSRLTSSTLQIHGRITPEKETAKLETKRRKAEECVKKADVEYYTVCLRAERSRLEWESAVLRGSHCFQVLEEERLRGMKDLANAFLTYFTQVGPKITQISDRLSEPIKACDLDKDIETVISLKAATEPSHEQILPDFYPEHTALAMNRERRKVALIKLLELIRTDLERERRGKAGVENLAVALKRTPTFASEDSQQNVQDKLHHMRSMLTYLEAARYKVLCVLSELEGRPKPSHPLADHIHVSRDRQGYQQSILKVPSWIHTETEITDWVDRGTADGTSVQPDSDFGRPSPLEYDAEPLILKRYLTKDTKEETGAGEDEFSSQGSEEKEYEPVVSVTSTGPTKCRALYNYTANLYDELSLNPGDIINIHDKQPDGWWLGELNGVVGIFPATYVEEIK